MTRIPIFRGRIAQGKVTKSNGAYSTRRRSSRSVAIGWIDLLYEFMDCLCIKSILV